MLLRLAIFAVEVLTLFLGAATEADGAGRAVVVAGEAAGAMAEPLGPTPAPSLKEGRRALELLNS